ncbi:TonB-dependent receptor [Nitrospirillum sp. BR 11163]|uniref:TonB-dependent receptor n=1 Tax=Nitrospirillum sp. BR 11163 TaxID=3104323 RepID=UPI002AFF74C5|nr:TonB-dependent receptor [Nitrospirillum sp. BR 11163]MEA1674252.1 TonB-dependent receptor [Nitrospirillum sp. BR 11163]
MKKLNRAQAPGRRYATFLKLGTGMIALATATAWVAPALAQSTASQMDEIIITGARQQPQIGGLIQAETAPKARSTVDQKYLSTETAGQSVLQAINMLPGVNFTNSDAYGSSGGSIRIRGFDGNRVSFTFDGIPLNDTGNYAIYSNQVIDAELVNQATVNIGTTDVDSPTASATGGTINVQTRKPRDELGMETKLSFGSNNFKRVFAVLDTGDFGPGNRTSAFVAASYQDYDKFKGPGDLQKKQVNGRIYEDLGGGDFISVAAHYNENRNFSYNTGTRNNYASNYFYDEGTAWIPQPATPGKADAVPSGDSNYYKLYQNPSNTGNVRGQSRFHLDDDVMLTVDPYFQYTLANGGGQVSVKENDPRLIGATKGGKGVDLNGDGDFLDTVMLYSPNNTNTFRTGVTSSVIWDINEDNRLRVGYTIDYGRHRQTNEPTLLGSDGTPLDVFGGKYATAFPGGIFANDGAQLERRNRYSIAELNQASMEYVYKAFDQRLTVVPALRLPFFHRELNQYCYTYSTAPSGVSLSSNQYCTSGTLPTTGTVYKTPFTGTKDFSDALPSLGMTYQLTQEHQVYFQFSEGFSAPRTDNLYNVIRDPKAVEPEKTYNLELGYRYQTQDLISSLSAWYTKYDNRIVSSQDPSDPSGSTFIDRSLGQVELYGVSAEAGFNILENLTFYGSASYTHSEVLNDVVNGGITFHTAGKMLVDTPEWMVASRVEYKPIQSLTIGLEGKYTGERAASDTNDEKTTPFFLANANVRLDLPDFFGMHESYLQFNVENLFDRRYLNTMPTTNNTSYGTGGSLAKYLTGAPRTFMGTIATKF